MKDTMDEAVEKVSEAMEAISEDETPARPKLVEAPKPESNLELMHEDLSDAEKAAVRILDMEFQLSQAKRTAVLLDARCRKLIAFIKDRDNTIALLRKKYEPEKVEAAS